MIMNKDVFRDSNGEKDLESSGMPSGFFGSETCPINAQITTGCLPENQCIWCAKHEHETWLQFLDGIDFCMNDVGVLKWQNKDLL